MRGGSGDGTYKRIYDALNQACGTAYDTGTTSNVSIENHAIARAIAEAWDQNRRLSFIHDPWRCAPSILVRWERVCRLYPLATDTLLDRRRRLAAKLARFGVKPTYQVTYDRMVEALGDVFVTINHVTAAEAVAEWPGGSPPEPDKFTSTVCRVLIKAVKPTGWTEGQYYEAKNRANPILDATLPAHMTYFIYRNDPSHSGGSWATDDGAGFILDTPANLDNQIFAS
jgi:uncharacterized protein YmfQ (DUF2313 family)